MKQQIVVYIFFPVTVFANNGILFTLSVYFVCVRGDMITKYTTFLFGDGTISGVYSLSPCSVCYAQNALFIVNWFYLVFVYYKLNWPTNWVRYIYVASCHACVLIMLLSLCTFHCSGNPEWESVELCGCIRSWVQFPAGALWIPHSFDNSHTYISVYTVKHSTIPFCIVWWASPIPFATFSTCQYWKQSVLWNGMGLANKTIYVFPKIGFVVGKCQSTHHSPNLSQLWWYENRD